MQAVAQDPQYAKQQKKWQKEQEKRCGLGLSEMSFGEGLPQGKIRALLACSAVYFDARA